MRINEFRKISGLLAKEHRIEIQEGKSWSANIKNKKVFYIKKDITNLPEDHILGLLLHEIAHIHYTTTVKEPKENAELYHETLNMLEDISIEILISKDYPNAGEILETTKKEVVEKLLEILPTLKKTSNQEKSLLYAAARFDGKQDEKETKIYQKTGTKIYKIMKKEKKLITTRKETKDLKPVVKKILDILIKDIGKLTKNEKKYLKEGQQKKTKDTLNKEVKRQIRQKLKNGTGWKKAKFTISDDINYINEIADSAEAIGRKLRGILKKNNEMEFGGKYRTGKLATKRLARIKIMKDRKPFKRKILKSNKSYAFAIATDISGSMNRTGKNNTTALECAMSSAYMVAEALRYAAQERTIILFGKNAIPIAPISTKKIIWEEIIRTRNIFNADNNMTNIDRAIKESVKNLNKTNAEKKIMIMLTDGSSDEYKTELEYNKAKKAGIECIAIAITSRYSQTSMLESVFGKSMRRIEIDDIDTLGEVFTEILKEKIKISYV